MIDTLPSLIAAIKACTVACTIALSPSIGSFRVANTGAHAPVTIDLGGQRFTGSLRFDNDHDITVQNGTIAPGDTSAALRFIRDTNMTARNLKVEAAGNGIETYMVNGLTVDNVRITGSLADGVDVYAVQNGKITHIYCEGFRPSPAHPDCVQLASEYDAKGVLLPGGKTENVEVGYVQGSGIMNAVTVFDDHHLVNGQPNGADNVYFHDVEFSTSQPNCVALRGVTHGRVENIRCHTLPSARWPARVVILNSPGATQKHVVTGEGP